MSGVSPFDALFPGAVVVAVHKGMRALIVWNNLFTFTWYVGLDDGTWDATDAFTAYPENLTDAVRIGADHMDAERVDAYYNGGLR